MSSPVAREAGQAGVGRLVAAGDLEPDLAGGRGADELFERRRLRLPTEAADAPVFQAAHASLDLRRAGDLRLAAASIACVGNRVDQARSKQGRRVALRAADRDRSVSTGHRPAPCTVRGVGTIVVQDRAVRLSKAWMNSGQESRVGMRSTTRRSVRVGTKPIFKPSRPEIHAE